MIYLFKALVWLCMAQGIHAGESADSLQDHQQRLRHFIEVQRFVYHIPDGLEYTLRHPESLKATPPAGWPRYLSLEFAPHIDEQRRKSWYVLTCQYRNQQPLRCRKHTVSRFKFGEHWLINRVSDLWSVDDLSAVISFVETHKPDDVQLPLLSIARRGPTFEVCYGFDQRLASASFYHFDRVCLAVTQIRTPGGYEHRLPKGARREHTVTVD
jgi:hypothetical protein